MPKFSIIMTMQNDYQYLQKTLDSIVTQTISDFELIIVYNGNIGTEQFIAKDYMASDSRINTVVCKSDFISDYKAKGLECANGEYILFIDSCDYLFPDSLQKLLEIAEGKKSDLIFFNTTDEFSGNSTEGVFTFDGIASGKQLDDMILSELCGPEPVPNNASGIRDIEKAYRRLYRKDFLDKRLISILPAKEYYFAELLFTLSCHLMSDKTIYCSEPIYHRRHVKAEADRCGYHDITKPVNNSYKYTADLLRAYKLYSVYRARHNAWYSVTALTAAYANCFDKRYNMPFWIRFLNLRKIVTDPFVKANSKSNYFREKSKKYNFISKLNSCRFTLPIFIYYRLKLWFKK